MRLQSITVASGGMALNFSINSETVILRAFSYLSRGFMAALPEQAIEDEPGEVKKAISALAATTG
jgi:hypothetical protein